MVDLHNILSNILEILYELSCILYLYSFIFTFDKLMFMFKYKHVNVALYVITFTLYCHMQFASNKEKKQNVFLMLFLVACNTKSCSSDLNFVINNLNMETKKLSMFSALKFY